MQIIKYDLVVVAEYEDNKVICYDIFGNSNVTLREILSAMSRDDTKVTILGFTPKHKETFEFKEVEGDDLTTTSLLRCWETSCFRSCIFKNR